MGLKKKTVDKKYLLLCLGFFALFAILAYFTPYTNDDWAWGGQIGIDRLKTFFDNYNGRYLGNLLILLITRSRTAMVVIMAISFAAICALPSIFSEKKTPAALLLSGVLFFLLPKKIYAQTVGWASGYSNYVPPMILLAAYYVIIKNIFDDEETKYGKLTPLATFLIAFAGSLFLENITLTNIAAGLLVIIFVLVKERKFHLTHVAYEVGAIVGAAFMFSNTSYRSIANGTSSYQQTSHDIQGLAELVEKNLGEAVNNVFMNNMLICFIASFLFVLLCVVYAKRANTKRALFNAGLVSFMNLSALTVLFLKSKYSAWTVASDKITTLLVWGSAALYCLSLFLGFILCIENKQAKFKLLLLLVTTGAVVAPLMVVTTQGGSTSLDARCYYPPYFIICMMTVEMSVCLFDEAKVRKSTLKTVSAGLAGALLALCVFYLSIFSYIHKFDVIRSEYIAKQISNKETVVKVTTLPYDDYIWASSPKNELWMERFKIYYGFSDSELEYVKYKDYQAFANEYDQSHY